MRKIARLSILRGFLFCGLLVAVGCSQPVDKTTVSAATGGVIGAGLGAIIGSQTGSTSGGLAIGAAAGTLAGAMIGNTLESQEVSMRTQDEAIERQEQRIAAQRGEIDELRRINQDDSGKGATGARGSSSTYNAAAYNRGYPQREKVKLNPPAVARTQVSASAGVPARAGATAAATTSYADSAAVSRAVPVQNRAVLAERSAEEPKAKLGSLRENDLGVQADTQAEQLTHNTAVIGEVEQTDSYSQQAASPQVLDSAEALRSMSPQCKEAHSEAGRARLVEDSADKLYHYRRALRLCPGTAQYHLELGETYLAMNRASDAEFELREALRLDPQLATAEQLLAKSGNSSADPSFAAGYDVDENDRSY